MFKIPVKYVIYVPVGSNTFYSTNKDGVTATKKNARFWSTEDGAQKNLSLVQRYYPQAFVGEM